MNIQYRNNTLITYKIYFQKIDVNAHEISLYNYSIGNLYNICYECKCDS